MIVTVLFVCLWFVYVHFLEKLVFPYGTKIEHNFFLRLFGRPEDILAKSRDISWQNPGTSHQKVCYSWVSRDIPSFLTPTPSRGRPPPQQKDIRLKSLGLCSFLFPWFPEILGLVPRCGWEFNRGRGRGWESRPLSRFLFRTCFEGVWDTIAPLSRGWAPPSGLERGGWELLPGRGSEIGRDRAFQSRSLSQRGPYSGRGAEAEIVQHSTTKILGSQHPSRIAKKKSQGSLCDIRYR